MSRLLQEEQTEIQIERYRKAERAARKAELAQFSKREFQAYINDLLGVKRESARRLPVMFPVVRCEECQVDLTTEEQYSVHAADFPLHRVRPA